MKKEIFYGPIVLMILWYVACWARVIKPLFLPQPHIVLQELLRLIFTLTLWKDMIWTMWRILLGFGIAALIGIPMGLLMGQSPKLYSASEIIVDFFRSLPALAVFPLLMFIFGIGDAAKIATTVFGCSLVIAINSYYGVMQSKKTRKIVAELMEANPFETFYRITLMDALPQVFVGMRTSLSLSIVIIVVTEMFVGTQTGVGHRIFEAQLTYRVPEMYACIVIAGLMGYILNKGFVRIEKSVVHWSGR
jgi:NitT/TauT family transport system permease protein